MKIRVLHIVQSMQTGGLENGIVNLANRFDSSNFQVDILCLREKGELAKRITNPNSRVFFEGDESHSILSGIKKVFSVCKDHQYHIIHSHGFSTMLCAYIGGKLAGTPIIMNGEHGTLYYSSIKKRFIQRLLFKKMAINLTVSASLKDEIISRFNIVEDNFKPVLNGVDSMKFARLEKDNSVRESLGIHNDDVVIGSVGRLVPGKNYISLIKAFNNVYQKHSNIHLILVGDGVERAALESTVNNMNLSDKIHLLGTRDDIPNILNSINIFVLPSDSEGMSNTLLESMACGTPVIASDVGGNSEIIVPKVTGFLFEFDNLRQLTKLLDNLICRPDTLKEMSAEARNHIVKNFSLESMVRNYEKTYIDLFNQHEFVLNTDYQNYK